MSRNFSLAVAFLTTAFSGHALADGINSFSQAKAAGVKVNADVPGDFYCGCKINWQGKKGSWTWSLAAIRCVKTKTAPAASNGSMSFRHGSLATCASAGRMAVVKTVLKILSTARWKAICITCSLPWVK